MNENKTISERELLEAIKTLLRKSGHLNKLQAEMRERVTRALQERQSLGPGLDSAGPPAPSREVLLVNELIREYLEWNGYLYTASVLVSEAAMTDSKRTRQELCSEVGVRDDDKSSALPLLANIVSAYTERIKRKISKIKRDGC